VSDSIGQGDGERIQRYQTWFWRVERPLEAKFAVEKAIRALLVREPVESGALIFRGTSFTKDPVYRSRFCLETVEPERHLYSLQMEAVGSSKWFTQEKLQQMAGQTWQAWIRPLQATMPPQTLPVDRELYQRVVRETLEREMELANQREDDAPTEAARHAVLDALRRGKTCGRGDKEGNTTFRFDGRQFVRDHIGDWDEHVVFDHDAALLADLSKFYYWDTHRSTYPHSPPEVDAWKFILGRMS
jgi:hypothetical protein